MYLKPLHKNFIQTCIKLEDQIKHRKAAWLVSIRDYIIQEEFCNQDAKILIEFRKAYTDKKGHVFHTNYLVKKKDRFPLQHRCRQKRLKN